MPEFIFIFLLVAGGATLIFWLANKLLQDGVGQRILTLLETRKKTAQIKQTMEPNPALEAWQKIVLQYARRGDGRVFLEELVADTPLSISQATQALDSLLGLDLCDLELVPGEEKHPIYVFKSFKHSDDENSH